MSTLSENPTNATTSLSKSKKKRMKRKQAKQNAGDDVSSVSSVPSVSDHVRDAAIPTSTSSGTKLNPIDSLRQDLVNRGYRFAEIEDAMSEMWDKNLPYDNFDDVLEFLKRKRRGKGAGVIDNNNNNDDDDGIIQSYTDTLGTTTTTTTNGPSTCVGTKDATGGGGYGHYDTTPDSATAPTTTCASFESFSPNTLLQKDPQEGIVEGEIQQPPVPTTSTASTLMTNKHSHKAHKRAASNLDIISKLQLVATYENLHDAIFAITQWANLAKPNEIASASTESVVLSTLLRRCILDCSESEYSKIFPYFFNLLCIFLPPNRLTITKAALREGLSKVFVAARKAVAVSVDMPEEEEVVNKEPITNVAERIASAVAKALLQVLSVPLFAETRCNAVTTNTKSATSLPQHVADANGYTSELVRLLQKRDTYKAMASLAGTATKISISTKARDDTDTSSSTTEISVTNKRRNSLFNDHDEILYNRLGETKVQHDSLLSQMDLAEARHHQERQVADVELQSCQERKETIALQKADLLQKIQLLQEEETALDEKQAYMEKKIGDISTQFEATKEHIENQLEGPRKVMKLARACRGLEDIMLSFQTSVTDSSICKVTANGTSGNFNTNDADKSVGKFLAAMQNYFQVEAQCVDALKTRSTSMCINLRNTENEIVECKNLGLKTNVLQLERSLTQISQGIAEDDAAIKRFMEDVLRMKAELVSLTRLLVEEQPPLILPYRKMLRDIVASLTSLSIPCDDLMGFIPDSTTSEHSHVLEDVVVDGTETSLEVDSGEAGIEEASSSVSMDMPSIPETSPTANETNVASAAPTSTAFLPKFSWASKVVLPVQKAEVKSFRQIQEEEKHNVKSS